MSLEIKAGLVRIHARTWIRRLHSTQGTGLQCFGSIEPNSSFTIAGGYKLHEFNCNLTLLKGQPDAQQRHKLKQGIGMFDFHKSANIKHADRIEAWLYIADELYSEVWANVATAGTIEIHVGPVESEDARNNVVWDRAKQKSLFITDFQITLTQVISPCKSE
jgi:hypothetical protein